MPYSIAVICVSFLFLPKITLIHVAGENAGIRLEDFVLMVAALTIVGGKLFPPGRISVIEILIAGFVAAGALSCLANNMIPLYPARFAEYFVYFFAGQTIARKLRLEPLLLGWIALNGLVIVLQYFGIIGAFALGTYIPDCSDRVMGITSGPWEIAATTNLVYAMLLFSDRTSLTVSKSILLFVLTFGLIVLTASRTGVFVHIALFSLWLLRDLKRQKHFATAVAWGMSIFGVISMVTLVLILNLGTFSERAASVFRYANIEKTIHVYNEINVDHGTNVELAAIATTAFDQDGNLYDISWLVRAYKWCYCIKVFFNDPGLWLLGCGPGVWGPAVDGGLIRIITENGLLGFGLFLVISIVFGKRGLCSLICVAVLLFHMVLIDIYLASKFMSLLFFLLGATTQVFYETRDPAKTTEIMSYKWFAPRSG